MVVWPPLQDNWYCQDVQGNGCFEGKKQGNGRFAVSILPELCGDEGAVALADYFR